jgi:flagellar biosynthesis/type III secretory pathway M-ring protein FliF/YscJ
VEYALAVILLIGLVALVVAYPLSRREREAPGDERLAALEAAKEAKYREIRDAELDFRMGKLSEDDYRATDAELRAQAIEILRELDRLAEERR